MARRSFHHEVRRDLAGLQTGDLIQKIDGKHVTDVDAFTAEAKRIAEAKPRLTSIFVVRGYRTAFVFVQPDVK